MAERMSDKRLAEIKTWNAERNRLLVEKQPNSAIAHLRELVAEVEQLRGERDEARELATVSLDILRNVSNEPMHELFGVDDMGELPSWFTRYGGKS